MNACARCGKPCNRRWCSQACNAADRKVLVTVTCPQCSEKFHPKSTEVARGRGRFCSIPCRRAYKAAHATNYIKAGTIGAHRIIAAQKIGRPLLPTEVVHHIDGNRRNNHPDNLEVFESQSAHIRHEARNGRVGPTHAQAVEMGRLSGRARRQRTAGRSQASNSI